MSRTFFITGTDTGVGKTHASVALIHAFRARGQNVCGFKPVASGCEQTAAGLRNADALALRDASGGLEPYEAINPYAFEPPIAPHLAAAQIGTSVQTPQLDAAHDALATGYDTVIVEGAGGWLVPLNEVDTFADWVSQRQWPVILVVALRLGCINHALLTAEAIQRRTRLAGWIANRIPPEQAEWRENLAALRARLSAPLLACMPPDLPPASAAERMDVDVL